ncbi:MAG: aminoacyl-tRNA hydrolase [Betaproteobacteria bacterium]|nr:aminoacyl-tRNA hydrolase [Betaproteobacteria bacterium]
MKLVVGLGNPGKKYERTRHNAGFWLVERFAAQTGTVLRKDAKFQALVGRHEPTGVWLLLPQCYMNSSGRPVQMLAGFFKISPAEMLVVHDDLDFVPGVAKIKQGGGIAGHNGLRDISTRLGSHDYWRLRIGIGHPGDRQAGSDYVLDRPSPEDRVEIDAAIGRALEVLPLALAGDLQGAMLKLHTQEKAQQETETIAPAAKPGKPPRAEKPAQTGKPQQAEKLEQPVQTAQPEAPVIAEKKSTLKSLFKKLMPDMKK